MTDNYDIPILLLIHRRADTLERVIDALRLVKPSRIYVSADGPVMGDVNDWERCIAARKVIEQIDWPCEVLEHFSDTNLGLKRGVYSGVTWFFQQCDEGIILEDDCVPNTSFFKFMQINLEKYRYEVKVMSISGGCLVKEDLRQDASYYFSSFCAVWGWGSWRRAWELMDIEMEGLDTFLSQGILKNKFTNRYCRRFWKRKLTEAKKSEKSWAFPWILSHFQQDALSITPLVNMVSNVGFGNLGTNATSAESGFANLPTAEVRSWTAPETLDQDKQRDEEVTLRMYGEQYVTLPRLRSFARRIMNLSNRCVGMFRRI